MVREALLYAMSGLVQTASRNSPNGQCEMDTMRHLPSTELIQTNRTAQAIADGAMRNNKAITEEAMYLFMTQMEKTLRWQCLQKNTTSHIEQYHPGGTEGVGM